jgi:hypothetical protein
MVAAAIGGERLCVRKNVFKPNADRIREANSAK